jgi:ferredoxin
MADINHNSSYEKLVDRLNHFPQGAPPSDSLYKILQILFSEREAELVAQVPVRPFDAQKASKIWKMDLLSAQKVLDELASRAILLDLEHNGKSIYTLPPPMAGFFEFSMMRLRGDVDQKRLGELFYHYCNVEDDFIKSLFADGETQLGRVYVHEPVLTETHVLDYERASEVIRSASKRGISMCYCRHKMQIKDQACDAPMDICMTFNSPAESLVKHGFAREVDVAEGLDLLQMTYEHNLVQFGDNVREGIAFICNCCGCCCEAMIAQRRFGAWRPIHTTNYIPVLDSSSCNGCGRCVNACPVEAMTLVSANDAQRPKTKKSKLNEEMCLGCGICVRVCPDDAIKLQSRPKRVITPLNSTHRIVMMAIERGGLQDLIFDKHVLWSHRTLSLILGVILKLPPIKQTMASQQMKSRYLEALIARFT